MAKNRPVTGMDKQFQTESDVRALRQAEEVKASPTRMKAAQKEAKKEVKELTKVAKGKR